MRHDMNREEKRGMNKCDQSAKRKKRWKIGKNRATNTHTNICTKIKINQNEEISMRISRGTRSA